MERLLRPGYAGISQFKQYLQSPTFSTELKNIAVLTGGAILISLVSQFTVAAIVTRMPHQASSIAKYEFSGSLASGLIQEP